MNKSIVLDVIIYTGLIVPLWNQPNVHWYHVIGTAVVYEVVKWGVKKLMKDYRQKKSLDS